MRSLWLVGFRSVLCGLMCVAILGVPLAPPSAHAQPAASRGSSRYEFNDSHFHLTNYVQRGLTPREFLQIIGTRVGRSKRGRARVAWLSIMASRRPGPLAPGSAGCR